MQARVRQTSWTAAVAALVPMAMLPACSPGDGAGEGRTVAAEVAAPVADPTGPVATAGRLVLAVTSAATASPEQRRCVLDVTATNDTGHAALNVQAAWMARTEGFGIISDYQRLGDFAAGEQRAVQLAIFGAPCEAVREVRLSRAVCTVGPAASPPQSCAALVVLDPGRFAAATQDSR